jgi:hypothetical protein
MTLFYGALGVLVAAAFPALFWPIAVVLLVVDLQEKREKC